MIINLPLWVQTSTNKIFFINLNKYRNTHFRVLSVAKKEFEIEIQKQVKNINKKFSKIQLVYTLYKDNHRRCDVNNICTIADKFFCDTLVKHKKLVDDDYKHLPASIFRWGGIDKDNPRVEVEILNMSNKIKFNNRIQCICDEMKVK